MATIIHWDKFSVGTAPFDLWLASYLLPPPIYVAAYVWHQRRAGPPTHDNPLPTVLRRLLWVIGGLLTAEAAFAFVSPGYLADEFPWMLTPLTARVLCGFLLAVGTILLSIARENDRDRVRVVTPTLVLLLPAVGLQMARYWDQVDTSSYRFWTTVGLPGPRLRLRPLPGPGPVAGDPRLKALGVAMLVLGYPVALGVLVRLRPVLRERRRTWFLALEAAMLLISVGWLLLGRAIGPDHQRRGPGRLRHRLGPDGPAPDHR